MFRDKMCKITVAPSDGLRTTLNNVVYIVIYVIYTFVLFFVFQTTHTGLFSSIKTRHTPIDIAIK